MKSQGSRKQNEQNWRELIEKCKSSGKCQREWCTENNISEKAFYYWRRKLAKETAAASETTIGEIVQIHLQSSHSEEKVFSKTDEIVIRKNGIEITMPLSEGTVEAVIRGLAIC